MKTFTNWIATVFVTAVVITFAHYASKILGVSIETVLLTIVIYRIILNNGPTE